MNEEQARRVMDRFYDNQPVNRRKLQRAEEKLTDRPGLYRAWCRGSWAAICGNEKERVNPYPPGARHDQWEKAFKEGKEYKNGND